MNLSSPVRLAALVLSATLLSAGRPSPAAGQPTELETLASQAIVAHQSGDLERAAALYVQALRIAPSAARLRSNLGAAYVGLGRYDDAISQYRKALETEDDLAIRRNLALALQKSGRLEEAIEESRRVLAAEPGDRDARLLLAECHVRLGQSQSALDLLQPAFAAAPEDKAVAYLLGTALLDLNRTLEAQQVMDRLFRDGSPESHVLMGSLHARRKDWSRARAEYEQARTADPKLPLVNFLYGEALMKERNDWAGAAEAFRAELALNANHYESNLLLGTLLREEGRYDEALRYLRWAERLRGEDLALKFSLGATQLALGRLDEAERLLTEVAAAAPGHLPTQMQLAVLYTRMGRSEQAAQARANAIRLTKAADSHVFQGVRESISDLIGKSTPDASAAPRQP